MNLPRHFSRPGFLVLLALLLFRGPISPALLAEPSSPGEPTSTWDLTDLLDHLPDLRRFDLPTLLPDSSPFRIYARPHFGDFIRRDYVRLPVGVKYRASEHLEFVTELEGYFTHGIGDAAGYGLSRLRLGAKHEQVLDPTHLLGWSYGLDFYTPLSRPPQELTDGYRHTLPYVALTRTVVPAWKLVGYVAAGADLLDRTPMRSNFGRNQLHGNATTAAAGITRQWSRIRTALTTTYSTTALLTDEHHDVYAIRPDILIPLNTRPGLHTRLLFTVGTRAVWGPDGFETGISSSLRIEFSTRAGPSGR